MSHSDEITQQGACCICLDDNETISPFMDPNPCKCKGTIRIHEVCLNEVKQHRNTCGICKAIYANFVDGFAHIVEKKMLTLTLEQIIEYDINTDYKKHGDLLTYRQELPYISYDGTMTVPERILISTTPYENGVIHGLFKQHTSVYPYAHTNEILQQETPYVNGQIHGIKKTTYVDLMSLVPYENGQPHGLAIYKYIEDDKIAQELTFVHGKIVGEARAIYKNGKVKHIKKYNSDGRLHGETVEYFDNGTIHRTIEYEHGYNHGKFTEYNREGIKLYEASYDNGTLNGTLRRWFADGQLREECEYVSNLKWGIRKLWHDNGLLAFEAEYINNEIYGQHTEWDILGNITLSEVHSDDPFENEEDEEQEQEQEQEQENSETESENESDNEDN